MSDELLGTGYIVPRALTIAREFRGLTRTELARRANVTRQTIVNLETGETATPTRVTVEMIAEALDVLPQLLGEEPTPPPPVEILHFRGGARVTARSSAHLLARASVYGKVTDYLAAHCSRLPPDAFAKVDPSGDIEDVAARVRRAWGVGADAPIHSAVRLLERAGAFVGSFEGGENGVDAYSWQSNRPLILCNSDRESPTRVRFGLLHEAGHLILHRGRETGDKQTEEEANRFASAMLLPRRAFWQEFPRFGSRLNWAGMFEMKARWGASVAAIVRRAYDLAIITPGQYKTACIGLSANGWRKREPGEPDVAEKPELAPSIAAMLAKHRPLTRELGLSPKALSELVNADESALIPPQNTVVRLKSPRRPS